MLCEQQLYNKDNNKMYTYKAKLMRVVDGDTVDAETDQVLVAL